MWVEFGLSPLLQESVLHILQFFPPLENQLGGRRILKEHTEIIPYKSQNYSCLLSTQTLKKDKINAVYIFIIFIGVCYDK